ncbi:hypothetical protein Q1695_010910 [Nippostrongylus brasiliensis]|nr:hypothetical protein Q1695_010910 [Nippostrongylus brasiliensis]
MFVRKRSTRGRRREITKEEESENIYSKGKHGSAKPTSPGGPVNVRRIKTGQTNIPLDVERALDNYVDTMLALGIEGLKEQFTRLNPYRCPDCRYCSFHENKSRNRYDDIVCLDATRVLLTYEVPPSTDYIHANWVRFEKHDRSYIVTQAPLENTIGDFWRMVYQEHCASVVNITQDCEIENGKAILYYPQHAGSFNTYDKMFVNTKKVEHEENIVIYTIEVLPDGCSNSHVVKMLHMSTWPENGVPSSGRLVLRLLRKVVANKLDIGPVVVHCSTGTGRSCCFVMIDVILKCLFAGEHVEMEQIFKRVRDQRVGAISSELLYVFVAYSVLDYIRAKLPLKYRDKCQKFADKFKAYINNS